jgi:hypothetical protein
LCRRTGPFNQVGGPDHFEWYINFGSIVNSASCVVEPESRPEPEPELNAGADGAVDESVEVSEEEHEQWIEIERLLKLVKPMRLQNAKQRQDQIRQSLVAMSVDERAVAVERLAAALEQ